MAVQISSILERLRVDLPISKLLIFHVFSCYNYNLCGLILIDFNDSVFYFSFHDRNNSQTNWFCLRLVAIVDILEPNFYFYLFNCLR